jgi:hypothetical protein
MHGVPETGQPDAASARNPLMDKDAWLGTPIA